MTRRRHVRTSLVLAALLAAVSGPGVLYGQTRDAVDDPLAPPGHDARPFAEGVRIRIHQLGGTLLEGAWLRTDADTVWYRPRQRRCAAAVPLHSVVRLDVRERRPRRQGALRWALLGFGAGAAVGAAGCLPDPQRCQSRPGETTTEAVLGSAVFVAVPLAVLGAVHGDRRPGHRWRTLPAAYTQTAQVWPRGGAVAGSLPPCRQP